MVPGMRFCGVDLKSSQKVVGYPDNIHATSTSVGTSCLAGQCYSMQGTKLGNTAGDYQQPA